MEKKVLVVEDEPDIREAIAETLADASFIVSTAENGATGLKAALAEHPDIVLLDIKMPVMGGLEMLQKLRQDPWGKSVKVIMLTSMDDARNVATAYDSNIVDYIIKAHNSLEDILTKVRFEIYTN